MTFHRLRQHPFFSQWLILITALIVLGSFIGYNIFLEHERTRTREEERLLSQTKIIQENVIQNLIATKDVLVGLRRQLPKGKADKDLISRLKILADALPGIRNIGIIDASGTFRASNLPVLIGKNFRQRDYFQVPRQKPDKNILYITPPFQSSLGVFTLNVGVIIPDSKGEFAGVVTASLDPLYFKPLLDSILYSPDMLSSLQHSDGTVFILEPHQENIIGKNLAQPGSFFTRHKESGKTATVFSGIVRVSGEERMIAQRDIRQDNLKMDKSLQIAVSRLTSKIYKGWLHDTTIQGGLFGLLAFASVFSLYFSQRRQRRFNKQAAADADNLKQSEERFRSFVENANDIIYSLNPDGIFTYVSPNWTEILGHDISEVEGHNFAVFVHPADLDQYRAFVERAFISQKKQSGIEYRVLHKNGTWRWHRSNGSIIRNTGKNNASFIGIARDITERKIALDKLQEAATHDSLTGLPNRVLFQDRLTQALENAHRNNYADGNNVVGVAILDADNFKDINDTYGHAAGDVVLAKLAQRIKNVLRQRDTVSRLGGDEFAIILEGIKLSENTEKIARKILSAAAEPIAIEGKEITVTASLGICLFPGQGVSEESILHCADMAMYKAKETRNNFKIFACDAESLQQSAETTKGGK